jgi:hypothetical protein
MTTYRTKAEPLKPHTIKFPFKGITAPPSYILTPEQCLAHGEYRDISPTPAAGFQLGEVATWDEEQGTVTMNVVAVPMPSAEQLAAELAQNIKMIEDARLRHLTDNIHPDALFMVREGKALGLPKATAFNAWCEALGMEMYHRIGLAQNGQWDMSLIDFSGFTPKPYEVGEIWQENSGIV